LVCPQGSAAVLVIIKEVLCVESGHLQTYGKAASPSEQLDIHTQP
jgi:hypothetical protein